ncbi:MAG TPA: L,D-transpeptidase [Anaerolineae bacterium]|nr:L,D-transpeptidase [Anaerolineae bacterium]HID84956.1 L,D-transpeptidase [Anaerolineales bacterium]HIQ08206.1 L,D-transpeptidase [Anaerolineaceae bacterium]
MRLRPLSGFLLLLAFLSLGVPPAAAQSPPISAQGAVLCPPVAPLDRPLNCAPLGAAAYVDQWGAQGVTFPLTPPPAIPIAPDWLSPPPDSLPYYAYVQADKARMYRRTSDGLDTERPAKTYPPGLVYVSYDWVTYSGHQRIYRVAPEANLWMQGKDLLPVTPSAFRGVQLTAPPPRPFGWSVANRVQPRKAPGLGQETWPYLLKRYTLVQVYDQREADELTWYMIGPNLWVEQRWVGLVFPREEPPEGVTTSRWIEINLFEQTLAAYEGNRLVFATLVSTGSPPFWTRPGLFAIYEKHATTDMRGSFMSDRSDYYMLEDVPWTMYFDEARALHGAYWHDVFGYPTSHGCVNLTIADAHWLFEWAQLGDQVYVWDPSGKTPTDPSLYGSGGF